MSFFGLGKKKDGSKSSSSSSKMMSGLSLGGKKSFKGSGQSLGGSRPGSTIPVIFCESGPLGMTIEKTESGSAVVARVEPGGAAEEAGVRRGDVVCWSGGGEAEFEQFMAVVRSGERPLEIDIKRIVVKAATNVQSSSAAEEQRRLAVMAAASERQKKAVRSQKPVPKTRPIDLKNNTKTYDHSSNGPQSEEARRAVQAAKDQEKKTAERLGYNPYESVAVGSGKAKVAHGNANHGQVDSGLGPGLVSPGPASRLRGCRGDSQVAPGRVGAPRVPQDRLDPPRERVHERRREVQDREALRRGSAEKGGGGGGGRG
eukprot:CAMPEP_0197545074 /NCGR_PEP_ID=MMETSP1320-20131121/266_1 /TAXON_ID=91990 /ORGANISM="Bolidomonas sp., Strain RCC2347" /LENGTH=314 /DNA_ID=CAMNT_0043104551 /DNA_START=188 /DNA_END=1128 /DNA_ORIENTATION=-